MKNLFNKIRQNHWLMMIICCATPLIILIVAVYFFNLDNKYLFWFIILLCPILHYFMMRDMHGKHNGRENGEKLAEDKEGRNQKCH